MIVPQSSDIVIVGGGHNGLVAAAYLAKAGVSVTVLERLPAVGGAAVSTSPFAGVDARLSRYSYLVSLLPQSIIADLGLDLSFAERRYSSYTPVPADPSRGLLVDTADPAATAASFAAIGAADDADLFAEFYEHCRALTQKLWPTLTEPLLTRSAAQTLVGSDRTWRAMIERPIGEIIERHLQNDVVRGVILTDALIGTFTRAGAPDLAQNICFLYHLIGQGTGAWNLPIGGMGRVTDELRRVALEAGATIVTDAEVIAVSLPDAALPDVALPDAALPDVTAPIGVRLVHGGRTLTIQAGTVLANVAPAELDRLLGRPVAPPPEGAQVKVNLLLSRLPRLLDESVTPEQAFGGTFHINEAYTQLDRAYGQAAAGQLPEPLPCEIYAHSLTDPSILSPELQAAGVQTLTVFALHVPHRLAVAAAADAGGAAAQGVVGGGGAAARGTIDAPARRADAFRAEAQAAVLASLNSVLAEPIEDCLLLDESGAPCIETKTTLDIEDALRMPGGNIFHGPLSWPFVEDNSPLNTPAERWGVATAHPRILLCGSGARRGGAVSGLGGHNAAMAVLELRSPGDPGAGHPEPTTTHAAGPAPVPAATTSPGEQPRTETP